MRTPRLMLLVVSLAAVPAMAAEKVGYNCLQNGGSNCTALIPDAAGGVAGELQSTITVPGGACASVERVCVSYGVEHSVREDLSLELSHGATTVPLPGGNLATDIFTSAVYESQFDGQTGSGAWTLRIRDSQHGEYGALNNWTLGLCCGTGCGNGVLVLNPQSGLVTTEAGGTANFDVELTCPPGNALTITPTSSDPTEGLTSGPLSFTAANWQNPQTVTVTGQDDALDDGNVPYQIDLPITVGAALQPVDPVLDLYNPPSPYAAVQLAAGVLNVGDELPLLAASKTAGGSFIVGSTVTYTIVLSNNGSGTQLDNPGDEFVDNLPAGVAIQAAFATSGNVVVNQVGNSFTWNGAIAPGSSVTITALAVIVAPAGTQVANQGQVNYDADGDGSNESTGLTDDPATPASGDPTLFVAAVPAAIPALAPLGLLLLTVGLFGIGWRQRSRL